MRQELASMQCARHWLCVCLVVCVSCYGIHPYLARLCSSSSSIYPTCSTLSAHDARSLPQQHHHAANTRDTHNNNTYIHTTHTTPIHTRTHTHTHSDLHQHARTPLTRAPSVAAVNNTLFYSSHHRNHPIHCQPFGIYHTTGRRDNTLLVWL